MRNLRKALTITTPENVVLSFEVAGVGSRFIACLLDTVLEGAGLVVIGAMALFLGWSLDQLGVSRSSFMTLLVAITLVVMFALLCGYYILFESRWNGQTPGKKVMGLRVIRDGGLPIDFPAALVRNLCRAADFLPALYGIGLVSILVSDDYKRLGDYVAGTLVVKERREGALPPPRDQVSRMEYVLLKDLALRRISQVSRGQYEAARRYLERSGELEMGVAKGLAEKIARPIAEVLGEEPPVAEWTHYLEEVVAAYEERVLRRPAPRIRGG